MAQRTPELDYHTEEAVWRKDVRSFSGALWRHWFWWICVTIGSGIASMAVVFIRGWHGMIPVWVIVLSASLGLVVASFLAFREQRRIAEAKELELIAERDSSQPLRAEIQILKTALADREKRKEIQKRLGDYHIALLSHSREIASMRPIQYADKYPDNFQRKDLDPDTSAQFEEIRSFLSSNVGCASVAIFFDRIAFETPPSNSGFGLKTEYHGRVIELVNKRANQLMKIIESLA